MLTAFQNPLTVIVGINLQQICKATYMCSISERVCTWFFACTCSY